MDITLIPAMVEAAVAALCLASAQVVDALVAPTCTLAALALVAMGLMPLEIKLIVAASSAMEAGWRFPLPFARALARALAATEPAAIEPAATEPAATEPASTEPAAAAKIWEFVLPNDIARHFPQGDVPYGVVGGQARVAAWCVLNNAQWPEGYCPRDNDHLHFNPAIPFGEIQGELITGIDKLFCQSFESYCAQLDLTSNGVMVKGGVLHMDELAYQAFSSDIVELRKTNRAFNRGQDGVEYLCLRAAVQVGFDISTGVYHSRAGALALGSEILAGLNRVGEGHWYMPTYMKKMEQVKGGNH